MKLLLSAFILAFSSVSLAAFQFKKDSGLPLHVQEEIQNTVKTQCWQLNLQNWLIEETDTETGVNRVDNGLTDTTYSSVFAVYVDDVDSNHSRVNRLTVKSQLTNANNGTSIDVQIIEGCL